MGDIEAFLAIPPFQRWSKDMVRLLSLVNRTILLTENSIGQQFALTEASYTTIRLLQAFKKIEPREFTPILELQTLTMAVRAGVKVGMTPV